MDGSANDTIGNIYISLLGDSISKVVGRPKLPPIALTGKYFANLITIDDINNVEDIVGERGLTFTLHDPVYGGEKFSPAIIGNGTTHKYLLYFDSKFPFVHQNIVTINLGTSYTVNQGVDVFSTMTSHLGSYIKSIVIKFAKYFPIRDANGTSLYAKSCCWPPSAYFFLFIMTASLRTTVYP